MLIHKTQYRVRYGDTDKMGYMYYGKIPYLYEIGRTELIRSLGYSYRELEDEQHIGLPVMEMRIRFIRPAYYDDEVQISTIVKELPDQFFKFHCEIHGPDQKLLNAGYVKLAFVDSKNRKGVQAPENVIRLLTPYFENS